MTSEPFSERLYFRGEERAAVIEDLALGELTHARWPSNTAGLTSITYPMVALLGPVARAFIGRFTTFSHLLCRDRRCAAPKGCERSLKRRAKETIRLPQEPLEPP
jgi:hypothetical protein